MADVMEPTGATGTDPRIDPLGDRPGIVVVDPIQRRRFPVETDVPVAPAPAEPDGFYFPVTTAVAVTAGRLELSEMITIVFRRASGEMVDEINHGDEKRFPADDYVVELHGPVKVLLRFEAAASAAADAERRTIEFDGPTRVLVGARSYHERPAGTVTTTADPADVMAAVSTLGSALKTTSVERSWPTLRGYPPEIELGDELRVPNALSPPDTGVAIEVPRDLGSVYAVSPLAYYLGATVRPGDRPRLVAGGFEHRLDADGDVADGAERALKQSFALDCVVRTEGHYDINLHERNVLDDRLDLDFASLYDAPLPEQLAAYLSVPYERVADAVPLWRLAVDVREEPSAVSFLPHVAYDLGVVRPRDPTATPASAVESALSDELDDFFRAPVAADGGVPADEPYVTPSDSDAIERAWAGRGVPLGAGKLLLDGYRNRQRWASDGATTVTVVCNDPEMSAEYDDGPLYGEHEDVPFDVQTHRELSVEALRETLHEPTDFLHYIGHAEDGALVCTDGTLDLARVDDVGAGAFLLNGCRSYDLGLRMVEAGAVGGVVTLSEVGNNGAIRIGQLVARLLNVGFSLRSALAVARERRLAGHQYVVVGDGGAQIVQSESFSPLFSVLEDADDGRYHLEVVSYPPVDPGMGSVSIPLIRTNDEYFLVGYSMEMDVTKEVLTEWFELGHEGKPVIYGDELYWSKDVALD